MATLYRGIWAADDDAAVEAAEAAFVAWVREKTADAGHEIELGDDEREASSPDGTVTVRREIADAAEPAAHLERVVRSSLVERRRNGSRWTTTFRAWRGAACREDRSAPSAWTWVDVEAVSHESIDHLVVRPPRFVVPLLESVAMRRGPVSLLPVCRHHAGADGAEELAEQLTHAERDVPIVVFGGLGADASSDDLQALEAAAQRTVTDVAGLAVVCMIDAAGREVLEQVLGEEYTLGEGAMRVYLPEVDPAIDRAWRHRHASPQRFLGRPGAAGRIAVRALAPLAATRRAPDSYDRARHLLTERYERSADDLDQLLEVADQEVAELRERLADEVASTEELMREYVELQEESEDLRGRLSRAHAEIQRLQGERLRDGATAVDLAPDKARDCSHAAKLARQYLSEYLEFPAGAQHDFRTIDRSRASASWGSQAWHALRALYLYARARGEDGFKGDFRTWCLESDDPYAWSADPQKLAMAESETVLRRWPDTRTFEVDGEQRLVQAHIKITSAGTVAPRIYFDYVERTGKVHVAYFGRHLRNTRT